MSGNGRARWWDPTSGNFQDATGGAYSLSNSAAAVRFTTPGKNAGGANDWVLVIDTE
jgi:hypothetical protein